jgi:predicted RNase H-like HicB family nuclease
MRLTAAIQRDGQWYVARCLEVEVASQGDTVEAALTNLREALELYFEDAEPPSIGEPALVTTVEVSVPASRSTRVHSG